MTGDAIVLRVQQLVERVAGTSREVRGASAATRLAQDYWLDSMELLEVVLACEREFGLQFEESSDLTPAHLATLGTLADLIRRRLDSREAGG